MNPIEVGPCRLFYGDCFDVLPDVGYVDSIITDPPFSDTTHNKFHVDVTESGYGNRRPIRKPIDFEHWTHNQISKFVRFADCGWLVVITDYPSSQHWWHQMQLAGRTTFAPLPYYNPGRSCRIVGDGPSSWTDWIIVSRTKAQAKWGTLPGGYVRTNWGTLDYSFIGNKPVALMTYLVRDYSRKGQTVCDPCMGSGTTAIACIREGRQFIGIEQNPETFALAVKRIEDEWENRHNLINGNGHADSTTGIAR